MTQHNTPSRGLARGVIREPYAIGFRNILRSIAICPAW